MALNYETTNWENGKTVLKAEHLRKIEKGITDIIAENDAIYKDEDIRKSNEEKRQEEHSRRMNEASEVVSNIQKDYDSLQRVIMDENASANLQNQINQTNSQLEYKANENEVRKKDVNIDLNDLNERTIQAIQGGGDTKFELLSIPKNNSVTIGKMGTDFKNLGDYMNEVNPCEVKQGWFNVSTGTYHTLNGWNLSYFDVIEGERYKYLCYTWEANSGGVIFLDENENMISYLHKGTGGENVHKGELIVPEKCVKMALFGRTKMPSAIKYSCYDFKNIKEVCEINNNIIENSLNYYELEVNYQNGYYNKNNGQLSTVPNYDMQYADIQVKKGEKYKVTCAVNEVITAGVIFRDSSNNIISTVLNGDGSNKTYSDYIVEVPQNAVVMNLTSRLGFGNKGLKKQMLVPQTKELGDINDIYLKLKTSSMYETDVMFKYSETKDMLIKFMTGGVNNLLTPRYFYLIENDLDWCCGDFSKSQTLMKNVYSDMIGPIRASAINNADGDEETVGKFVGGWHGTVTNNMPSARLDTIKFFIDDKEVTGTVGIYKGKEIRIEYLNYLQGWNTTNSSGTGREILIEKVTMRITKGKIDIVNKLTALEDVLMGEYYGIQTENGGAWNDEILFLCDGICKRKDFTVDYDCSEKTDYFICKKDKHYLTAYMKDCGLGRLKYNKLSSRKAHSRTYGKVYFDLIANSEAFTLNQGDSVWWNGGYILSYENYRLV